MSNNELKVSNALLKELTKIDPEFPLQWARCFHEIAMEEGITLNDVSDRTGIAKTTISRIIAGLSDVQRRNKSPYGLVKTAPSPMDSRAKEIYLTARGKALVDGIKEIIERNNDGDKKARK